MESLVTRVISRNLKLGWGGLAYTQMFGGE